MFEVSLRTGDDEEEENPNCSTAACHICFEDYVCGDAIATLHCGGGHK